MKSIFSEQGRCLVEALKMTKTVYVFDFDGTLAPIVKDPNAAQASLSVVHSLRLLSKKSPVAILSGRSLEDLKLRFKDESFLLVGNHGLEGLFSKKPSLDYAAELSAGWESVLASKIKKKYHQGEVLIENKQYSLALHYRLSRQKKQAKRDLLEWISELDSPPRVIMGKCVINLLPTGGPHKGVALLEIMKHFGVKSALYIGDDDTDEDVFSLPSEGVLTIRVGRKRSSMATFFIDRQSQVGTLLKLVLSDP